MCVCVLPCIAAESNLVPMGMSTFYKNQSQLIIWAPKCTGKCKLRRRIRVREFLVWHIPWEWKMQMHSVKACFRSILLIHESNNYKLQTNKILPNSSNKTNACPLPTNVRSKHEAWQYITNFPFCIHTCILTRYVNDSLIMLRAASFTSPRIVQKLFSSHLDNNPLV